MKALISAGGRGTRLRPITHTLNKHLFPIANKPMIFYALEKVSATGIKQVGININQGDKEIKKAVGSGKKWGVEIEYIEQKGGALGLAHVVKNAKDWIGKDELLFYLGDNIISGSIKPLVNKFKREKLDCLLALSKVPDPERFGVPVFKGERIVKVEEKPENPKSNFAVTGIYVYSNLIVEAVSAIKPSSRDELEISDAHTYIIEKGGKVGYEEITGWWKDTGKPEDLLEGNGLVLANIASEIKGSVDKSSKIKGRVFIGKNTKIGKNVSITGPAIIGQGCRLKNSVIESYTSIADGCEIRGTDIYNTIICDNSQLVDCKKRIANSLIGRDCKVISEKLSQPRGHRLIIGDNTEIEL
ncbi:MAG: glucose-1-phosphate thymidylyltransferase [Candidatus Moranbacteria bacterium]|nr:glucose-1-phosphate thymidylyltransferase [Candidatus Moranbacteria bacterium]